MTGTMAALLNRSTSAMVGPDDGCRESLLLIGLKMLAETYDVANASTYNQMLADAAAFLRDGLNPLLYYYPLPSGDGAWHRIGLNGNRGV